MSPNVVVFRDTLDNGLVELSEDRRFVIAVMTVAAPRFPAVVTEGEREGEVVFKEETVVEELREKVRLVLRMAAGEGVGRLVLGAMGCGAYGCPPRAVAKEMKGVLGEEEFEGWFESVDFAVYAKGPVGMRNLEAFREVFGGE